MYRLLVNRSVFCLLGLLFLAACDPCATVVCENARCDNGSCLCDKGYFKNGDNCAPIHLRYIGTGTVTATQLLVDSQNDSTNFPAVQLTLQAVEGTVYSFTLVGFNNQIKNDLVFTISSMDNNVIATDTNPQTTTAGNTYSLAGTRTGNQITLVISSATGHTYTLQYTA
jgi:hypothetical protein